MSTHPQPEHDLDRTDELPRLDVEAYEARLAAEQNDPLASTDAWSVQGLREAEDLTEIEKAPVRFPRRSIVPESPQTSDVTLDATRILERIQQLESELAAAKQTEGERQAKIQSLTNDLAAREKETRALSADNARLAEQRSIVVERVRALEQQLQEETADFERDLAQQRDLRAAENSAATTARLALEHQVAELTSVVTQLRQTNARLDDETKAAAKLANTHIELIEQFKQRVASEEKNSAQLARHLAAKIAEHVSIGQEVARRDATIQALATARDDLAGRLEEANRNREALVASLTTERDGLTRALAEERESQAQVRETLSARAQEIELARDGLSGEMETLRSRVQQLETEVQRNATAHESLTARTEELQQTQDELASVRRELTELATRDQEREEAVLANAADLAAARRQMGQQSATIQSLEQAIRARDTLTERLRAELQMAQDERAIIAGQLEKSRARNKSMAREIFARDNQVASLKADLAVHVETLAAIRQDVSRTTAATEEEHPDRILEPVDHDGDIIVLDKKLMTIGRTDDNDICVPSKLVSRSHARLLIGPNAVIVEDAGSTNGCFVNDVLVKQQLMREGDVLAMGDLKYRLRTRPDNATRTRGKVIPFAEGRSGE